MGCQNTFFFLFQMFASSLAKGRWTEWEPALLSAVLLHVDQAVNDCAGTEVASVPSSQEERKDGSSSHFCMSKSTSSMQPLRWRACSEHWGSQGHLHSGQNVWWILGSNHITQQDEKLVTAPSPSPKKPSPGWVFQSWWQRTSFSPWDHTKMLSKAWQTAILCQSTACKFASGLTMFYHWQQCKMLFRECSVHWAACSRSGRGKDRTTWIPDSCSQGSTNPTHLKVRHLLEASFLGFLCGQWKDISRGQFLPS